MKSRYNHSVCLQQHPTSAKLHRNTPGRVRDGQFKTFGLQSSLNLKDKFHIVLTLEWVTEQSGVPFLWVTSPCTRGYCHALVNPASRPLCHSWKGWHYTNTMLRAMPVAISDTTSKSGIFMEEPESHAEKHDIMKPRRDVCVSSKRFKALTTKRTVYSFMQLWSLIKFTPLFWKNTPLMWLISFFCSPVSHYLPFAPQLVPL